MCIFTVLKRIKAILFILLLILSVQGFLCQNFPILENESSLVETDDYPSKIETDNHLSLRVLFSSTACDEAHNRSINQLFLKKTDEKEKYPKIKNKKSDYHKIKSKNLKPKNANLEYAFQQTLFGLSTYGKRKKYLGSFNKFIL